MTTRRQNNFTAKPQKYTIIQTTNKARDKKNRKTIMSNLAKNLGNINADSSIMSTGLGVIAGATLMKMFDTMYNSDQPKQFPAPMDIQKYIEESFKTIMEKYPLDTNDEKQKIVDAQILPYLKQINTKTDNILSTSKDLKDGLEKLKTINTNIKDLQEKTITLLENKGVKLDESTLNQINTIAEEQIKSLEGKMPTQEQIKKFYSEITLALSKDRSLTHDKIENLGKDLVSNILATSKDLKDGLEKLKNHDAPPAPIESPASQLFRNINTDNDETLSDEEMLAYYGPKSGSHLTDYTILQKYKKFGSINVDNEKEKLQEWNTMMCLDKQKADKISSLLDKNGTTFGGFLGLGGTKFFTDEDLLKLGLSGKTIETIKKYDSLKNNGNNDGKISKEEAINAAILGGASFTTNTLTQETQNLFNHLGGEDNIVTENEINILKKLGYDPKEIFNTFKINIGNKSGIVLGDFENVANKIDLNKINTYIETWPDNIKQDFLSIVDKDGDGKISSKDELCAAIDCIDLFKDKLATDILRPTNFTFTTRDGAEHNIIQVLNKHMDNENHFKYDENHNKFIQCDKEDVNKIHFDNEQTKDILTNGREFIDIGTVTLKDGRTFEGITLLDDNMKNAIAKTYGKEEYEDCNKEEIENFTQKWQCGNQNDVYNLGALTKNMIIPDTLFGNESIINTETLNKKTIAGFDQTGQIADILDYADGKQDGYIDKNIFTDEIVINGTTLKMDKNGDGLISNDEFNAFIGEAKNAIGEQQLKDIFRQASSLNLENINHLNKGQNTYNEEQKNINNEEIKKQQDVSQVI